VWACHGKKNVTMIFTCHKDEMGLKVNKANKEETRPTVVCDCDVILEQQFSKVRCYSHICMIERKVLSRT
jgi:hypothetical protein